jgi:eukaryotic-like serine/threonine-protein kinase
MMAGESLPRQVGRYAIFDEIASGGMATVYLGRLSGSGGFARTVAIKRLHAQFAKDPEFVAMFLDEARLAARIRHPNVVPTLDVVASSGEVFLVMEYVQGEALGRLVRRLTSRGERVPVPMVLRILSDALQGLHAAHEARDERGLALQIVHRDVTPQNILVGVDGVARLLDFGVAKAAGRAQTTREGQIKGKLAYMAPEQLMGMGVTRETDLYAASVVLWELLAGRRLFSGGSEVDVVAQVLRREIARPSTIVPDVPKVLDDLVMKGLASKAEDRFASAREMCVALGACGLAEAPSIAVGEWVEALAADAIAERSAKIAVIETHPGRAVSNDSLRPALPDPRAREAPAGGPLAPTVRPPSGETPNPVTVTMNTAVIRMNARVRAWGVAAAVVVILAVAGVATLRLSPPTGHVQRGAPDVAPAAVTLASAPPVAFPPESKPAEESSSAPPIVSSAHPARRTEPAAVRRPPAAALARTPRLATSAAPKAAASDAFSSRE